MSATRCAVPLCVINASSGERYILVFAQSARPTATAATGARVAEKSEQHLDCTSAKRRERSSRVGKITEDIGRFVLKRLSLNFSP